MKLWTVGHSNRGWEEFLALLQSRGTEILHILRAGPAEKHPYTSAATLIEGRLSYAGAQPRLL